MAAWGSSAWTHYMLLSGALLSWHCVRTTDVKPQKEIYTPDYNVYHNLSTITSHMRKIAASHSGIVRIDWSYQSRNHMPQLLTRITNFSSPQSNLADGVYLTDSSKWNEVPKVRALFSFGEHAREFFPVESFFYLLKNITNGISSAAGSYEERFSRMVLSHFDIYAVLMANPDGRRYVESTQNYCWRGTSTGVDLNRNFNWQFASRGSSGDPKDEEYRGPHPFSEPECKVYTELTEQIKFDAFLSFHSGIRHIYMPFADTASKSLKRLPPNFHNLHILSQRLATATSHQFRYGTAYDLNFYTADGTAFDFMAGVREIPFCLAIEMWENEHHKGHSCFDEFNPHSKHLITEVTNFHPMYVELFSHLRQWKQKQLLSDADLPVARGAPSITFNVLLLLGVVMISIVMVYRNRQHICANRRRIVHLRRLGSTFNVGGIFR